MWEFIKSAGLAITVIAGGIGVLGDFRTSDKKITRLGVALIIALIVAAVATIGATLHDDSEQEAKLRKLIDANNQALVQLKVVGDGNSATLKQLGRLLQPFGDLAHARFQFVISADSEEAKRAIVKIEELLRGPPNNIVAALGSRYIVTGREGKPPIVSVPPVFLGGDIQAFTSRLNLAVELYAADSKCCAPLKGDLNATGYVPGLPGADPSYHNSASLEWDTGKRELSVVGWYQLRLFVHRESLSAYPDLLGSTLTIRPFLNGPDWNSNPLLLGLRKGAFNIAFAQGKTIWIGADSFMSSGPSLTMKFTFPSAEPEFSQLLVAMPP